MDIAIVVTMFVALWGWLAYEIFYAPTYDDIPFEKPSKRGFHIDVDEDEINDDLFKRNDKEDIK